MAPPQPPHLKAARKKIDSVLKREFTTFFVGMVTPSEGWPAVSDEQFIDALAASLVQMGERTGKGVALTQTLVYELQERINLKMKA